MGINLCMSCSNFDGHVQLSFRRNWVAGISGCISKLWQGKRELELGVSIETRRPWKQNSDSVPQLCQRFKHLSCKSSLLSSAQGVGVGVGVPYIAESEKLTSFLQERAETLAMNHHRRLAEVELTRDRPLDMTLVQTRGNYIPKSDMLDVAYERCREVLFLDRDPFGIGSLLMKSTEKKKAFWAIWSWGRRLDEVVDGVYGSQATDEDLDRWEQRIIDTFQGRPWDIYDVAVCDMVSKLPLDILLFNDLIDGTRSDMTKKRFENFDELYLHLYRIASSVTLLFVQAMGISPESKASLVSLYHGGITLGIGLGLIDCLRDVGNDASLGRNFFPQDELSAAGLSDADVFGGKVTEKWRKFMKGQIKRASMLVDEGAALVVPELIDDAKWGFWTALLLHRQFLEIIEANGYDVFTKKTDVGKPKMLQILLLAYAKSYGFF